MEALGDARRPLATRVYGVRLLYKPEVRRVLARLLAGVAVVYYLFRVTLQYVQLAQFPRLPFDYEQFRRAAQDIGAGRNPYQFYLDLHCTTWCLGGYIYTPLVAVILRPLNGLDDRTAAILWATFGHLMLVATIVVLYRGLRTDLTRTGLLFLLAAGLLFLPVLGSVAYLQPGTLLTLTLATAAVLYLRGRSRASVGAGAALGTAIVMKVTPILVAPALLPLGWARDRAARLGQPVRDAALAVAGLTLAAVVLTGGMLLLVPYTDQFFTMVLPRIGAGTTTFDNQSLPGVVAHTIELLGGTAPSAGLLTVAAALVFVGIPIALGALARPEVRGTRAARAAFFAAFLAAMPIASSITWWHHLVVSVVAVALLAVALWPAAGTVLVSQPARWLLVVAFPLMAVHIEDRTQTSALGITDPSVFEVLRVQLFESANLWGMLALWLAAVLVLWTAARPRAEAT
ncbi:MAG TPA: glycosyltransferase family 87 protein [Candidatus Dormibacteraeota bacterium]|jgi:hypothetical protein|nr:glycosyltransferase family 87 protein [Candidatus Dormibacteraeota bacterium]